MTSSQKSNIKPQTIFTGDNLDILRGFNSEIVDLIYLDPPFNSNQDYAAPIGSEAAGAEFKDTWEMSDVKVEEHGLLADQYPAVYKVIDAAGEAHGKPMQAYLIMMASRVIELKRVLKQSGSIYLHCDDTASHYLKIVMDAVFGSSNYRNHLIWRRAPAHNDPDRFGRILDHILLYSKSEDRCWNGNAIFTQKTDDELATAYPSLDERGRFRSDNLTGPRHAMVKGSPSTLEWRGYDVFSRNRVWAVPKTSSYAEYIERNFIPGYRKIEGVHDRLDALDDVGLIHHPKRGFWPGLKRYADADKGNPPQNLILKPTGFTNYNKGKEFVGYPTQKRVGLLERFIKVSSNPGDLVLDPFCGCATALVAAHNLERAWVGIDISPKAADLVNLRLIDAQKPMFANVIVRDDIPKRTDVEDTPNYRTQKHSLFGLQEGLCAGCLMQFPFRNFTVDHIVAQVKGGTDHAENLQLLCNACNSMKGTKSQAEFLVALKDAGLRS